MSQFEKAALVAKLRASRDRKSAAIGHRIEGPKLDVRQIEAAKRHHAAGFSLRKIAAEMENEGFLTKAKTRLSAAHVARLVAAPEP